MKKTVFWIISLVLILSLALTACQEEATPEPTEEPTEEAVVEETEEAEEEVVAEPTEEPTDEEQLQALYDSAVESQAVVDEAVASAAEAATSAASFADQVTAAVEAYDFPETEAAAYEGEVTPNEGDFASVPTAEGTITDRKGSWVDEVSMVVVDVDSAITQIEADAIDIYAAGMATADQYQAVVDAGLEYSTASGLYYELTINPGGDPTFANTGKLNPFSSAKIREALNWVLDRDWMNQEIYGGIATPKFFPTLTALPDYSKHIEYARALEAKYAYDFEKGAAVFDEEMAAMGAEMVDGTWQFDGEPVEVIILIRNDSDGTRVPMGDYIGNQLEELGFVVDRQYKTSSEASPLWIGSDPEDGLWHLYTGAWSATVIDRDTGDDFQFFGTPQSVYGSVPLWQAYDISEEYAQLADDLANNNYSSMEERAEMFGAAMEGWFDTTYRVWLIDGKQFTPWKPELSVSYDIVAGVDTHSFWPYTLRWDGEEGGLVRWGTSDLFVDPINAVGGSNWTYDQQIINAIGDYGVLFNPFTGVQMPQRIEKADVQVLSSLPVTQTYDWVNLEFVDEVVVPEDVWFDWDVENQVFLTPKEAYTKDLLALPDAVAANTISAEDANASIPGVVADFDAAMSDVEAAYADKDLDALTSAVELAIQSSTMASDLASSAEYAASQNEAALADVDTFIDVIENGLTAKRMSRVYYPADLYDTVKWHDGSSFSIADIIMGMIMTYEPGSEGSAIYDESAAATLESSLAPFKGWKIVSEDPLIIEQYSDFWSLDAEGMVNTLWPNYGYGDASMHLIALSNIAEANGELAYSSDKAEASEIEWMSWVSGPSMDVLAADLDAAIADTTVPYEPTLGAYITAEELATRYENLKAFYEEYGHFYAGTGPLILSEVYPVEQTVTLKNNSDYVDSADKWSLFSEPKIAEAELDGPGRVTIGEATTFDVYITFNGEDYPVDEVSFVKYLLFSADGSLVEVGEAAPVGDGYFTVELSAEATGQLEAGACKLEIAAVVIPVALPSFASFEFVAE